MKNNMIRTFLLVLCISFIFSGCTNNSGINIRESTSKDASIVKIMVRKDIEKVFSDAKDITIFENALKSGTRRKNVPSELKPTTYFVYFYYSNNQQAEHFLYIGDDAGWIYKNGSNEAYTLSKKSLNELNALIIRLTEAEAISKAIKNHPEFPNKVGICEGKEPYGPNGSSASVKFETQAEEKSENNYLVILIKTWSITVNGKVPVSYWKYDVSPKKISLVEENAKEEELISIIK